MPDPKKKYLLSDVTVETVGLVSRGAVTADGEETGKNFLLLKTDKETAMEDELVIEEVETEATPPPELPAEPPDSWLETVKGKLGEWGFAKAKADSVSKPDPAALGAAVRALREGGYSVDAAGLARMLGGGETDEEKRKTKKEADGDETPQEEPMAKQTDAMPVLAELVKAEVAAIREQYESVLGEVRKSNEDLQKSNEELREQVGQIAGERDVEKQARRRQDFVKKAEGFRMLPLTSTDLGDLLLKAADGMETEDFEKLEALLKAGDRQLALAGIFGEIGTARTPEQISLEDRVAKAAKETGDPAKALLEELTPEEQAALLKEWDGGER